MPDWNEHLVPAHTLAGLIAYRDHGVPTGDFLHAVLCDKLVESFARADRENGESMGHICAWLYNCLPRAAWGNEQAVVDWMERHAQLRKKGASDGRADD